MVEVVVLIFCFFFVISVALHKNVPWSELGTVLAGFLGYIFGLLNATLGRKSKNKDEK